MSNTVCDYWPISFRFRLLKLGIELTDLTVTPKRPTRRTFFRHIIINELVTHNMEKRRILAGYNERDRLT